ncbi:RimK domain protein ATP-grasp (fragment) [Mesorhizobium metallidurans STM 2683]|uniref:RimK domain protein ATP-grasp n=2 Tax=Mesorhizobium metallidurans TaxID=489722 RepID=M5EPL9_9HYPH
MGGETIYKMFHSPRVGIHPTRRLRTEDFESIDRLITCPAIFQERIRGEFDIRATVVGDRVFAARIIFAPLEDVIDTRFVETEVTPWTLPADVEEALIQMVADFGLVYSAVDMRYSDELGYVFFESNPEGQYLWLEIEANLEISHAIASRLLRKNC